MTSWPWMKGIDVAIADPPIAPVCPEDDRPAVKDLILEHREKIDKITAAVQQHPLYDPQKHDDLWMLRFWLSHKKSKAAIDAAKYTLDFRSEHKLDDQVGDIRDIPPHHVQSGKIREFLRCWKDDAMVFTHPDPQRGVVAFLKITSMDQHTVVERLTEDYWLEIFLYCSEWCHQWLDYTTRTTGRLTKSVRLVDAAGIKMSMVNRECSKRDGKAMGVMEDCYPQLLETVFVCSPPTVIKAIWKIVRTFLPKRVVSKFDMINPKDNASERQRLYRHITESYLPKYYGGQNPKLPTEL